MKASINQSEDMSAEYDFSKGIRGKHHQKMKDGYTITIYSNDKSRTEEREFEKASFMKIDS